MNVINNHPQELLSGLNELRQCEHFCDVTLKVKSHCLAAHRVILAGSSPYFKAMLTLDLAEKEKQDIQLNGIDIRALKALLDFMYTGRLQVSWNNVHYLVAAAQPFQMNSVVKECCNFFKKQILPSNCIGITRLANIYGLHELYEDAHAFTLSNFELAIEAEEFHELDHHDVKELLMSDKLHVLSEDAVFKAVQSWILYKNDRVAHFFSLMKCIRLPLLSRQFLHNLIRNNELVQSERRVETLLQDALQSRDNSSGPFSCCLTKRRCLPDRLCAVGGKNGLLEMQNGVEVYELSRGEWQGVTSLPVACHSCGVVVTNGDVYVVGGVITTRSQGLNCRHSTHNVWCWSKTSKFWHKTSNMLNHRSNLAVVAIAGEIYAFGGTNGKGYLRCAEKFNLQRREWYPVTSMMQRRMSFCVIATHGMVIALGGYNGAHLDSVEQYDVYDETWTPLPSMPSKRIDFGATVIGRYIYVIGGHDGSAHLRSLERYDFHSRQWSECVSMSSARTGVAAASLDGCLYVVGGHSGQQYMDVCEKYDPELNVWTTLPAMTSVRCNLGLVAL